MLHGFESQTTVEFLARGSRASARAGCVLGILFSVFSAANLLVGTKDPVSHWIFVVVGSLGVLLTFGGAIGNSRSHTPLFVLRFEPDGLRWGKFGRISEAVRYQDVARIYCYWQDAANASFQLEFHDGKLKRVRVHDFSHVELTSIMDELRRRFGCPVEEW